MEDDRLAAFKKVVEDFEKMMSKQEVDMNVVWNLDKAVLALLDEPRLILEAKEYLESINPFMRTIILTHTFRYDLFRAIYTGELSIEEYEEMVKRVNEMVQEAIEETFRQVFESVKTPEDMDMIKERTVPTREALEFYEGLARDYRKKYGTDDQKRTQKAR